MVFVPTECGPSERNFRQKIIADRAEVTRRYVGVSTRATP